MAQPRQTRFSDVCGTVDELKRVMAEDPQAGLEPEALCDLVDDCTYMVRRMQMRLDEFHNLRDELTRLLQTMQDIPDSRLPQALDLAQQMKACMREEGALSPSQVEDLSHQAEGVRSVAGEMEHLLRASKAAAIELRGLYSAVEGGRDWNEEMGQAELAGMEARLAAWLPPEPHRQRILDYLAKARAHLLPAAEGEVPFVQFEDGGVMALSAVRWSDAVSNFVPASFNPDPRARRYRPGGV